MTFKHYDWLTRCKSAKPLRLVDAIKINYDWLTLEPESEGKIMSDHRQDGNVTVLQVVLRT